MRQRTRSILMSGYWAIACLLFLVLITAFPRSAMADDEPDEDIIKGTNVETNDDPPPLCHRFGIQTSLVTYGWYGIHESMDAFFFSLDTGAFYEWEVNPYFSLGPEFNFTRPVITQREPAYILTDVFRVGARLRVKLPVADNKVELFILAHGGVAMGQHISKYINVGTVTRGYFFGGIGLTWWIKPSWSLSIGLAGPDVTFTVPHIVKVPVEVMYRF